MKKLFPLILLSFLSMPLLAKENENTFQFTTVKENKITPVKNQNRSSTCWSFSGIGLIEAELLRLGKPETDLSEMFVVSNCLNEKAERYVRLHGSLNYAPGGSFEDVIQVIKKYGMVPESVLPGLKYGQESHVHNELDALTKSYVDRVIENKNGKLSTAWKKGFEGIVSAYIGSTPEKFTVDKKEYTPLEYTQAMGINADDYITITSFTHHPFYTQFALEIPDNWRWSLSYNVPLNELQQIIDNAVMNGYTVAWAADVSEKGFTRNGLGVVPDIKAAETSGSDQARWLGLSAKEKDKEIEKLINSPSQEIEVTQELRQIAFDNYETTDDHGMLIYGIAKDQTGKPFYMVKNSWGETGKYKGLWYVSAPYVKYKTTGITLHKNAIPKDIAKKLGLK